MQKENNMPINFETDFVQPLLLDFENGKITDAASYSETLSKYYERAVSKGMPNGIPPTMPAPALTTPAGPTIVPIGTGAGDAYKQPTDRASVTKMENVLSAYFTAKEIFIAEGALEGVKYSLEYCINKAKWTRDKIQSIVQETKMLIKAIKEFPEHVKVLIEVAKEKMLSYKESVDQLKKELDDMQIFGLEEKIAALEAIESRTEEQNEQLAQLISQDEAQKKGIAEMFAEELKILDAIKGLDMSNVGQIPSTIKTLTTYIQKITKTVENEDKRKAFFKKRLAGLIDDVVDLAAAILEPSSFGRILSDFKSDKASVKAKIAQGKTALKKIQFIVDRLEPQLRKLEKKIKEETEQIEDWIQSKTEELKEQISQKAANVAKKKKASAKQEKFVKAKKDIEDFKEKNEKKIKVAVSLTKASTKLIDKAIGVTVAITKLKSDLEKEIPTIKEELEGLVALSKKTVTDVKAVSAGGVDSETSPTGKPGFENYVNSLGLGSFGKVLTPAIENVALDFQTLRTYFETPKKRYSAYEKVIKGLDASFADLHKDGEALIAGLKNFKEVKLVKKPPTAKRQERIDSRSERRENRVPLRDRATIIKLLKRLKGLSEKVEAFKIKQQKKLKEFIDKKKKQLEKLAEQIEIAVINAIPIKTQVADTATKKEKAEQKKLKIKETKVKLEQIKKKVTAIALVGTGGGELVSNISSGKYFASDNNKPLTKIADGMFTYETVGVSAKSAAYGKATSNRNKIKQNIKALEQIEQYAKIAIIAIKETTSQEARDDLAANLQARKDRLGKGFIADVEFVIEKLKNEEEGGEGSTSALILDRKAEAIKMITDFINTPSNDPKALFSTLKNFQTKLKGKTIKSMIKSLDFINALIQIEDKYLSKTKSTVKTSLGLIAPPPKLKPKDEDKKKVTTPPPDPVLIQKAHDNTIAAAKNLQARAKKRLREISIGDTTMYEGMVKLNKALDGSESFILVLIDMLLKLINKFTEWVKKKITKWVNKQKDKLKEKKDRIIKENEAALDKIKKSIVNIDAFIQQATFGLSAMLYWAGANWTNTAGTKFVVISIGPYGKLKKVAAKDGLEVVIREIASNFKKQLDTASGLTIPSSGYGIPPFPFSGYK